MSDSPMTRDQIPTEPRPTPFAQRAARFSLFAPLIALCFNIMAPQFKSRQAGMVVSIVFLLVVLVSLILAIIALCGIRRHGKKGIKGYAMAGLILNGVIILVAIGGTILLVPALRKVKETFGAGYTRAEMEAMPEVIAGSHKILDETGGFRIEIPPDFTPNPEAIPPQMVCSFIHTEEKPMVINIVRLGGRILGSVTPQEMDAMKSQLPEGAEIERGVARWGSSQLDAFGVRFVSDDTILYTHFVQVPLVREGIQISVTGPAHRIDDCRDVLDLLLTTLKGVTYADAIRSRQEQRRSP